MGLLEYQAMPSLLCLPVAHGWLCTFNIEQQLAGPLDFGLTAFELIHPIT